MSENPVWLQALEDVTRILAGESAPRIAKPRVVKRNA